MRFSIVFVAFLCAVLTVSAQWSPLKTGAGGWITGLYLHPSGDPIYARSDVGGAYRYQPSTDSWKQIVTGNSLPSADAQPNNEQGVLSIAGAPSDPNIVYMAFLDNVYRSTDQGDNWVRTNIPGLDMAPNDDDSKLSGERLAVDPLNPDVVYFGSIDNGLYRTFDGGQTWTLITVVPSGMQYRGIREIKFGNTAGSTNGRSNLIYASIDGEDVYRSTDAGQSWSPLNVPVNGPYFLDTEITSDDKLYVVGHDQGFASFGALEYDGNNWRTVYPANSNTFLNIAIDPFNANRALLFSNGFTDTYQTAGLLSNSPNWAYKTKTKSAPNIPWIEWFDGDWFTIGEIQFDPVVQGKLWISDGVGVWTSTDLNDGDITWVETSNGQEHLVSNDIVSLPNGQVVTAHWDRPIFHHSDLNSYPATHGPINRFNSSWSLDASPSDPNFLVAIVDDHRNCCYDAGTRSSGYSTDGGISWTKFDSMPGGGNKLYGQIAVSANNNDNIVWLPADDTPPYFTTDRGATWTQTTIPGASGTCCLSAFFFSRLALTADRVLDNTFYLYDFGNGAIHTTTDGGLTWTTSSSLGNPYAYNGKLLSIPGQAGHLFFANGIEQDSNAIEPLVYSTNGGMSWTTLQNTERVLNVAVGAAEPGASYPTLFLQGRANGVYGIFKSTDQGSNWTQIGTQPLGLYGRAKVMEGNPYRPGVLYMGFSGHGFVYYQDPLLAQDHQQPDPAFNLYPNPGQQWVAVQSKDEIQSLTLFDVTGKVVGEWQDSQRIPLQDVTPGIYMVKVLFSQGGSAQRRLVVAR